MTAICTKPYIRGGSMTVRNRCKAVTQAGRANDRNRSIPLKNSSLALELAL